MSDNPKDPVEVIEHFEDKLFGFYEPHMGFRTPAKARDNSLCERDELALPFVSDKDLAIEIDKLVKFLELPDTIYYKELLKATSQRLRFLSGTLERVQGKEVIDMENPTPNLDSAVKTMQEYMHRPHSDELDIGHYLHTGEKVRVSVDRPMSPEELNQQLNDAYLEVAGSKPTTSKLVDIDFDIVIHPDLKGKLGDGILDVRMGKLRPDHSPTGNTYEVWPLSRDYTPPPRKILSLDELLTHPSGGDPVGCSFDPKGPASDNTPKEFESPLINIFGAPGLPGKDSVMVSTSFVLTRKQIRERLRTLGDIYGRSATIFERLCFHAGIQDNQNLGDLSKRLMDKDSLDDKTIMDLLDIAKICGTYEESVALANIFDKYKKLVDGINPPYGRPAQTAADEKLFATTVVAYNPDAEPPVMGHMKDGLNSAWITWYRNQDKGHSLMEARDEGLRRIAELKSQVIKASEETTKEPPLKNAHGGRNPDWVRWYQAANGCLLKDALAALDKRISEL